jgi:hypothetical protein
MSVILKELQNRFGEAKVFHFNKNDNSISLILIDLLKDYRVQLLVTDGFSQYCMPVPENLKNKEKCELYFCLPSYWDLNDKTNQNMMWIIDWLPRITDYAIKTSSWFSHGHTIQCSKENLPLSQKMKQEYLVLSNPIYLEKVLRPINDIHFLSVIPIFKSEFEYKQKKGMEKLINKFIAAGVSEKLDDFRLPSLKRKFRLF